LSRSISFSRTPRRVAIYGLTSVALLSFSVAHLASQQHATTVKPKAISPAARAQQICIQTEAAFILNHDRAKARQGFLSAIQIDARYAPTWFNLGVLAEGDKSWVKAAGYFRQYLMLQPTGPDSDRAKEQLQILSKYVNGSVTPAVARSMEYDAAIQRARTFLAHGYFHESIAEAGRAQSLDSSRWEAYAVVSLCMAKQNKAQEAAKFQSLAIDHAPVEKRDQIRAALSSNGQAATQ
jgi:tetratricopeptide (TPR) repeat protein